MTSVAGYSKRALISVVADGETLTARPMQEPVLRATEVAVQVAAVGLCRTDVYVVDGKVPARRPIVPGHEFSGVVADRGTDVQTLQPGDRVAVNPILPCGECRFCLGGAAADCQHTSMLGVDRDGACCSLVVVPERCLHPIPESLSFEEAAFAEPVAASLAVTRGGIHRSQSGLIVGENRIARLTQRILHAHGFTRLSLCESSALPDLPDCEFDFAIETHATTEVLTHLVRVIRPRGDIILKSRQFCPVELTLRDLLPKEPVLRAVNYGRFEDAVALLAEGGVDVGDLVGQRFPFSRFVDAFEGARCDDDRKTFLVPDEVL